MTAMPADLATQLDDLTDKVDRLALRHAELQRTNALLVERLRQAESDRDQLKARLLEARSRVEQLLDRVDPVAASDAAAILR